MNLVDPWYGDEMFYNLMTDEDELMSVVLEMRLDNMQIEYELSDAACMKLCGALESELE